MLNCLKLWNNGGWYLSWRWWPLTILSKNLMDVMLLYWSKMFRNVSNFTTDEDDGDEIVHHNTSGMPSPMASVFSRVGEQVDVSPADFLPLQWLSFLVSKWGFFTKEAWPDCSRVHLCTLNPYLAFGFALALPVHFEDWDNPGKDCWWACARDQSMWP